MGKPKRGSRGLSGANPAIHKQQVARSSAEQAIKEQEAAALLNQGRLQDAEAIYRELIAANSHNHIVHGNLAAICGMQGRYAESIELLQQTLAIKPNYPEAHYNLGIALRQQGELSAAIAAFNTALQLKPDHPEAHYHLGITLRQQGELSAAIAAYNSALRLKPNHPQAHYNLGNALQLQGEISAAIAAYNSALRLKPNYPEAHNNLGQALQAQGELSAAITAYNTALQLNPNQAEAHNNLGNALRQQGELSAAITAYNTALQLNPNQPEVHNNLGVAYQEKGDLSAAIAAYNRALRLKPNYAEAHWNSALTMLLGGDYQNGWEQYEWRSKRENNASKPHARPACDQWSGETALRQTNQLLLVTEQGLGDTLQFMRYATALRNQGIAISICAQPKLHSLIQASGIDPSPLTPEQANQVSQGQWIPLLSVPRHLEVSPENPIITKPYIKTTDKLTAKWAGILSHEQRPIIGINWQGNPETEKKGLRGRSFPLETLAPITDSKQRSLLSLQKGSGSEQLASCSFKDRFVSCQAQVDETWDFLETAAIIANCDLVISSDTSVAHLAAGLGKTTWLLLHHVPDWRWGLSGATSFWYPTMRLFRQPEPGNWQAVMEQVREALQAQFGGRSGPAEAATVTRFSIKPEAGNKILAPISLGELIDKITILQIKTQHLQGSALENVKQELEILETTLSDLQLTIDPALIQRLREANQNLWDIENEIRDQERLKNFGETFIRLARSVYQQNDRRSAIKKEINITHASGLVEEKLYQPY